MAISNTVAKCQTVTVSGSVKMSGSLRQSLNVRAVVIYETVLGKARCQTVSVS